MTYFDPPTMPQQALPPPYYGRSRKRVWPWFAGIATLAIAGLVVTLVLVMNDSGSTTAAPRGGSFFSSAPQPISRAELMSRYAEIAPLDRSATPEAVDALALGMCSLLDKGKSTDFLISTSTDVYGANATKVVELLVSYKCPKYLKDFK